MPKLPCPRCAGASWVEDIRGTVTQRCLCGLTRPLLKRLDGTITLMRTAVPANGTTMPAIGTKISKCLLAVAEMNPHPVMTGRVAQAAGLQNKETASLLITLMTRGLVERVSERRGMQGGSEWKLTLTARQMLKL